MYINGITENSYVELKIKSMEGKQLTLETIVLAPIVSISKKEQRILVKPIYVNGILVQFKKVYVEAKIHDEESGRLYRYTITKISSCKIGDQVYHILYSPFDVKPINRRENVRVSIGEPTVVRVGINVTTYPAFVRDVSVTGVAFSMEPNDKIHIGTDISAVFYYEPTDRSYRVTADIVRCVPDTKSDNVLVGCKLQRFQSDIASLVSYILRQECKLRRDNLLEKNIKED